MSATLIQDTVRTILIRSTSPAGGGQLIRTATRASLVQGSRGGTGPQGPKGDAGADGSAGIPDILDGGNF
jgi:hypothetical protein